MTPAGSRVDERCRPGVPGAWEGAAARRRDRERDEKDGGEKPRTTHPRSLVPKGPKETSVGEWVVGFFQKSTSGHQEFGPNLRGAAGFRPPGAAQTPEQDSSSVSISSSSPPGHRHSVLAVVARKPRPHPAPAPEDLQSQARPHRNQNRLVVAHREVLGVLLEHEREEVAELSLYNAHPMLYRAKPAPAVAENPPTIAPADAETCVFLGKPRKDATRSVPPCLPPHG